jgi:hypothetical protein
VLGSALVFIVSNAGDVRRALFWKDEISVVYFSVPGTSLFVNYGDGDLYVSSVEIRWLGGFGSASIPIDMPIEKGKSAIKKVENPKHWLFLANKTGMPGDKLLSTASQFVVDAECVGFLVASHDANYVTMMNKAYGLSGRKLIQIPIDGYLDVQSAHTGKLMRRKLDGLIMIFQASNEPNCNIGDLVEN